MGPDPARLASLLAFVELHIEQGRRLVDLGAPVGIATAIWPHGRWRCSFRGEPNHAGTTLLADRHDPMLPFAAAVIEAREIAEGKGGRATFAKVVVWPNATNAVAARVDAWLDARAPDEPTLKTMVAQVGDAARRSSAAHGVQFELLNESLTGTVEFEQALRARLVGALGNLPQLPTAAGHDAGTLSACVPAAMLFVRNPTGTSHSPAEWASVDDCVAGARALARVLEELACR
jgi:N-carbamoyl-L-amino-acid hydrolase